MIPPTYKNIVNNKVSIPISDYLNKLIDSNTAMSKIKGILLEEIPDIKGAPLTVGFTFKEIPGTAIIRVMFTAAADEHILPAAYIDYICDNDKYTKA